MTFDALLAEFDLRGDPGELITAASDTAAATEPLARRLAKLRPAWMRHAECAKPEHQHLTFITDRGQTSHRLRAVCHRCPVRPDCFEYALADPDCHGYWGGSTAIDRRNERARRQATEVPTP